MIIDRFRGEYAFLSNFHSNYQNGKSVEHYYQAAKATNSTDYIAIINEPTPGGAKRLARTIVMRDDWNDVRMIVMEELLKQKFIVPKYSHLLLNTGDAILIEGNKHRDTFWGSYDGIGENNLGKLLMKIRASFLSNESVIEY